MIKIETLSPSVIRRAIDEVQKLPTKPTKAASPKTREEFQRELDREIEAMSQATYESKRESGWTPDDEIDRRLAEAQKGS